MTPAESIARLDAALARSGSPITLQRLAASGGEVTVAASVTCKAAVRRGGATAGGVGGSTAPTAETVVISPTEIDTADWTSGRTGTGEEMVPMKGNRVVIGGRKLAVETATAVRVQGVIVRIELTVIG